MLARRSNVHKKMLNASPVTGPSLSPRTPAFGAARTPSTPDNTPPERLPVSVGLLSPLTSPPLLGTTGVSGGVVLLVIRPKSYETVAVAVEPIVNVYAIGSPFTSVLTSYPAGASTSTK